ncbi:DNA polymerase III subunit beta [Gammaproteobacteria bacterium AB-CW1]|uniref:Beta sliding clamp n=1 Tax=Natronospira elongata TaxID=3110268 RepID=A0AAP6JHL3_9GAMM|nr:DNA polymerase III subunit beta [Gammaproteobacteria bacterium AB-CW1]
MKFELNRDQLLKPVQAVSGVVERRQTMPVLANIQIAAEGDRLTFTGTDLEVEMVASGEGRVESGGEVTVPGRKLLDICKALPEGAEIVAELKGERMTLRSGKSRFTLSTLPAAEFPVVEDIQVQRRFEIPQAMLRELVENTQFSMAQQDVRYYLNGLLLEVSDNRLRAVATDGHRLALCEREVTLSDVGTHQVIVPRKGVLELQKLLSDEDTPVEVALGANHLQVRVEGLQFTSKLIDGRFPDYERVIPRTGEKVVEADRLRLRESLQRASILSNEKYRGVRLELVPNALKIQAHNPEQEEAEEEVEVGFDGEGMEIGFNVNYLLDALSALDCETVRMDLIDSNNSCLIRDPGREDCKYVVMPMRL